MTTSEQLNELFAALSKAQAEMSEAGLNNANPFFKSKYASLTDVMRAARPAMKANGLSVSQHPDTEEDVTYLITVLGHASGQFMQSRVKLAPPKTDVQSLGSYITYMKRYAYTSILGVIVGDGEDDDGNAATGRPESSRQDSQYMNARENSPSVTKDERISAEQLEMLVVELKGEAELAQKICDHFAIDNIRDLPKGQFMATLERVRNIKEAKKK